MVHEIWKIQVTAVWTIYILKTDICFLLYCFTNTNFCHWIYVACIQDLMEKRYAEIFHGSFWFGYVKETDVLFIALSFVHISVLKFLWRKHFLKIIHHLCHCYLFCCLLCVFTKAATGVLQNSQENTCARASF